MSTNIGFTINGVQELDRELARLEDYVQNEILRDCALAGGLILVNAIKSRALELDILLSGNLIRSYHIGGHTELTPDFNGAEGYADIGGESKGPSYHEITAGTNLDYAPRQEFGFSDTDSAGRSFNQPARPHVRWAFDTQRAAVQDEIADTARELLHKFRG